MARGWLPVAGTRRPRSGTSDRAKGSAPRWSCGGTWESSRASPSALTAGALATASEDQSVRLWDARTGQEIMSLSGQTSAANQVAFSADGNRLAAASGDGTVRIWEAPAPSSAMRPWRKRQVGSGS